MKNTLITLTILLIVNLTSSLTAQSNHYLLVTIENASSLEHLKNSSEYNALNTQFNFHSVEQVFSNSKKEELRKVYSIKCNCSYTDLSNEMKTRSTTFKQPEIVEETELLVDLPNDYNLVFSPDYSLELIKAKEAWDITTGSPNIIIGISDSNYDLNHQEFTQQLNYVEPNLNHSNITHGTAVATSASGATDNAKGKSAIGYNTKLSLHSMTYNGVLNARNQGARVVNLSWASSCSYVSYHQSVINELFEDGVIVVAAAGNGSTCGGPDNLVYPAAYNNVIAVTSIGATMKHEQIEGNINSTHQHNASVDIAAPGYGVPLTFPNNSYGSGNGTSFAAPLVSGTIGLMLSVNDKLNPCEAEIILKNTALNIDSLNEPYEGKLGAGLLNAYKAVKLSQDFQTTSVFGEVFPDPNNNTGSLNIIVNSDAPIQSYYADLTYSDTSASGEIENTYNVFITYETGCVFKTQFKSTDAEYYNDSILVLPVEQLILQAKQVNDQAEITWSTESESNNSHFELYKSTDGFNWELIHTEAGMGYATSQTTYSFIDSDRLQEIQYFQIHQYDFNGHKTLTDIVSLSAKVTNDVHLYPNPCSSHTTIESDVEISFISISDQLGKIVQQSTPNSPKMNIITEQLKNGVYYLTLELKNGDFETKKLIVNQLN
jgi:subtilisin family serine protease